MVKFTKIINETGVDKFLLAVVLSILFCTSIPFSKLMCSQNEGNSSLMD